VSCAPPAGIGDPAAPYTTMALTLGAKHAPVDTCTGDPYVTAFVVHRMFGQLLAEGMAAGDTKRRM